MIWMSWRQQRRELLIFSAVFVVIAAYFLIHGRELYAAYYHVTAGVSVALCRQQDQQMQQLSPLCNALIDGFFEKYNKDPLAAFGVLMMLPLAGMFLGAPLVASELEHGTFRLAWTQGVTRTRWLLTKLSMWTGIALLAAAAFSALLRWYIGPFGLMRISMSGPEFAFGGVVALAYMAFALALGIAAGALLRRTIPAMFATLVGFASVEGALMLWARPRYLPPLTETWDPSLINGPTKLTPNAWLLFMGYVDHAGRRVDGNMVQGTCSSAGGYDFTPGSPFTTCMHTHGWLDMAVWQPAERFGLFQGIESAILLALTLALLGVAFWRLRAN